MSDDSGRIKVDPLFVGLTRPTLIFGVSQIFFILNSIGSMSYYVLANDFKALFVLLINHLVAYIICAKEPLFMELYMIKLQKCNICRNQFYHGANSYDMY